MPEVPLLIKNAKAETSAFRLALVLGEEGARGALGLGDLSRRHRRGDFLAQADRVRIALHGGEVEPFMCHDEVGRNRAADRVHHPKLENKLIENAMTIFYDLREIDGLKKKPSTSELIDWLKLIIVGKITEAELGAVDLSQNLPPFAGALLKNEQDQELLSRIKLRFRR